MHNMTNIAKVVVSELNKFPFTPDEKIHFQVPAVQRAFELVFKLGANLNQEAGLKPACWYILTKKKNPITNEHEFSIVDIPPIVEYADAVKFRENLLISDETVDQAFIVAAS